MRCSFEIVDRPCCREYLSGARRLLVRRWRVSCQSLAKRWRRLLAKLNKLCFGNYQSHGGGVIEKSACCWLAHIMDRKSCGGGGASPFITCHHHWLTPWKSATIRNWRRASARRPFNSHSLQRDASLFFSARKNERVREREGPLLIMVWKITPAAFARVTARGAAE